MICCSNYGTSPAGPWSSLRMISTKQSLSRIELSCSSPAPGGSALRLAFHLNVRDLLNSFKKIQPITSYIAIFGER